MLGQPRGGYGTIIIAWQPSMRRTAAHKNCPAQPENCPACSRRANTACCRYAHADEADASKIEPCGRGARHFASLRAARLPGMP